MATLVPRKPDGTWRANERHLILPWSDLRGAVAELAVPLTREAWPREENVRADALAVEAARRGQAVDMQCVEWWSDDAIAKIRIPDI